MNMNFNIFRRDFLRLSLLPAIYGLAPRARAMSRPAFLRKGLSILQGATDDSKTQFSIVHTKGVQISAQVKSSTGMVIEPDKMEVKGFSVLGTEVTRLFFSGLTPNQDFTLVLTDAKTGVSLDTRVFQTLDLKKTKLSYALCSCMDERYHDPALWQDVIGQRPDVIFMIGDSVYTDYDSRGFTLNVGSPPDRLWKRFSESRQILELYYSPRLIPVIGVWDDHDFAGNDIYSNYEHVVESQQNYMTFFAQEESHCSVLQRGPGIGSAITLAGQLFILMDDRSFRLESGSTHRYAQWGQEQEEWALGLMRAHQGPTWFFNGTQIFPHMFFKESVSGGHAEQFKGLCEEIKKIASRVVFGSGDVHFSEISKIEASEVGYATYELTSSGFHSNHIPGAPWIIKNDRRIESTGNKNYLLVTGEAQGLGLKMNVQSRSKNAQENFKFGATI